MKAKTSLEPNIILSFFEKFAENRRTPFMMLMIVYMLSQRKIDLKPSFLDCFFVEDEADENFVLAAREVIKEVQDLLSSLSLVRKQKIENILASLVPGYEKENFLTLSTQIMCTMGLPFLKAKAKKNDSAKNLHELFDAHEKNKKLEEENSPLRRGDGGLKDPCLALLLEAYQDDNAAILDLEEEQLLLFIKEIANKPVMMLTLIHLFQTLPKGEIKLNTCLKQFFAEHFKIEKSEECSCLSKIFEVYPNLLLLFRKSDFFQKLIATGEEENNASLLSDLMANGKRARLKLLGQLLFSENQESSLLNPELIEALCVPIDYGHHQQNFSGLCSLLSLAEGRDFATKMFYLKPELIGHISSEVFYRRMHSPNQVWHNWSPFSMLVFDFFAKPKSDALIFSFYKHNPTLNENLSYEALCIEVKGMRGYMGLKEGDRCTALGLLVTLSKSQPVAMDLLIQLLRLNPDVRKQITAKDLCRPQVIEKYEFTVYEHLAKDEVGRDLLAQLKEDNPQLQAEIEAQIEENAVKKRELEKLQCLIS